uniref:Uncharacterized protein n=1 Tax=Oryza barthii TaxID=65489 RepID=A0A0D3HD32_9ORYZ
MEEKAERRGEEKRAWLRWWAYSEHTRDGEEKTARARERGIWGSSVAEEGKLEAVSIISGRMKCWTLECGHILPLLQFMQVTYRQWHHLVVSLLQLHRLSCRIGLLEL